MRDPISLFPPSKVQHVALAEILESQRELYNTALACRQDFYKKAGKGLTYFEQAKELTVWRNEDPEAWALPANLQRWTLIKLENAYQAFWKLGGFPRFKGRGRFRSFGFAARHGFQIKDGYVTFKGMPGKLRYLQNWNFPEGSKIKTAVFTKKEARWYVSFQYELPDTPKVEIQTRVGLDLGLTTYATLSDGSSIENPRFARNLEGDLKAAQRSIARKKKGSKGRERARRKYRKLQRKIWNRKNTWLHQKTAELVKKYDLIAVENLSIASMMQKSHSKAKRGLNRSISDASWSQFLGLLSYKAERAGKTLVKVDPRGTSQECSGCGEVVKKDLSVRLHSCPSCSLEIDRDLNAAINILARSEKQGQSFLRELNVRKGSRRALKNAA